MGLSVRLCLRVSVWARAMVQARCGLSFWERLRVVAGAKVGKRLLQLCIMVRARGSVRVGTGIEVRFGARVVVEAWLGFVLGWG